MKNYYLIVAIYLLSISSALSQISIGSPNPNPAYMLNVTGEMTIRDKIYVGGNDELQGNPGNPGQVLVSQGAGLPPKWRTLSLPNIEGNFFYLIYNNSFTDFTNDGSNNEGISIGNSTSGNTTLYTEGTPRNNSIFDRFYTIAGLTKEFEVFSSDNNVFITFETVVNINSDNTNEGVDFSCGIFTGGSQASNRKLIGVRKTTIQQTNSSTSPFLTFTLLAMNQNIDKGKHMIEVACTRNANYNYIGNLGIGRAISTNINNFISKTSLKVEVFEAPDEYQPITD